MRHQSIEMILMSRGYLVAFHFKLGVGTLAGKSVVFFYKNLLVVELIFERRQFFGRKIRHFQHSFFKVKQSASAKNFFWLSVDLV